MKGPDNPLQAGDSVLFIQLRAMGDSILTTPAVRDFKQTFPDVNIDFLAEPIPAQALKNNPHLRRIVIAPVTGSNPLKYFQLVQELRRAGYKVVFDFLSTPGSAVLAFLAGAKIRCGYDLRSRSWAYNRPVKRRVETVYNPITKYDLFNGFDVIHGSYIPELHPDGEDVTWAGERLSTLGIDENDVIIALAPWSKRRWRRLSLSFWNKLVKVLNSNGRFQYLLFASESERLDLEPLLNNTETRIKWAGTDSILGAAALMGKCNLFLGSDNGLLHVAAAMGSLTMTLISSYDGVDPDAWQPPGVDKHPFMVLEKVDEQDESVVCQISETVTNLV